MKAKKDVLIALIILISGFVKAQEAVLCALQKNDIKIESIADVPVTTNNTGGTITLTHQDQNVTDIFAQYLIYDFYQTFPNSNPEGELYKYYTIVHGDRTLINELYDYMFPDVYTLDPYEMTSIDPELINLLDNKTYKLVKYCTESSEQGGTCPESEQNIPDGFELKIAFEYDAENDLMHAESVGASSCGNSFSIDMRGGFDDEFETTDKTLQLWKSDPGISTISNYNQPCHAIEQMVYSILDIGCLDHHNYGNIKVHLNNGVEGEFVVERDNTLFAIDFLTFQDEALSIDEETLKSIKPFEIIGNPYLQLANLNLQSVSIEIYNTTGQQITPASIFEENTLNISQLTSGLYFIRISNLNNQQKIFKFLKN